MSILADTLLCYRYQGEKSSARSSTQAGVEGGSGRGAADRGNQIRQNLTEHSEGN